MIFTIMVIIDIYHTKDGHVDLFLEMHTFLFQAWNDVFIRHVRVCTDLWWVWQKGSFLTASSPS